MMLWINYLASQPHLHFFIAKKRERDEEAQKQLSMFWDSTQTSKQHQQTEFIWRTNSVTAALLNPKLWIIYPLRQICWICLSLILIFAHMLQL